MKNTTKTIFHRTIGDFYIELREEYRIGKYVSCRPAGKLAKGPDMVTLWYSDLADVGAEQKRWNFGLCVVRKRPAIVTQPEHGIPTVDQFNAMMTVLADYHPYHDIYFRAFYGETPETGRWSNIRIHKRQAIDPAQRALRDQLAERGLKLWHKGDGRYWVLPATPMTLDEIATQLHAPTGEFAAMLNMQTRTLDDILDEATSPRRALKIRWSEMVKGNAD